MQKLKENKIFCTYKKQLQIAILIISILLIYIFIYIYFKVTNLNGFLIKPSPTYKPDYIITHEDIYNIEAYLRKNPDVKQVVSEARCFFSHASVGKNILEGIKMLNENDSDLFQLKVESIIGINSDDMQKGRIYEINRGNPEISEKIRLFEEYIEHDGWGQEGVIANNKLCYIDAIPYDNKQTYTQNQNNAEIIAMKYFTSMNTLEVKFPNTFFIYTTIPITNSNYHKNLMRQFYNNAVRLYCLENNKVLFDIANIESHSLSGKKTFLYHNDYIPVEALCDIYTIDGGHLVNQGKYNLALGWYAMVAYIASFQKAI